MPKTIGILGKKVGMTRVYDELGFAIPVTVVEAGPCTVLQVKTIEGEGYNAIQLGFDAKKPSRVNKPQAGHCKKAGTDGFYHIREFRVENPEEFEVGQQLPLDTVVKIGELVDVQGKSKGRGFQGVMRRHGFKGGGAGHGSGFHRAPGSIGCSAWPARVIKGKKMPGRMGNDSILKKNIKVVDVRPEDNVVLLKGSVPGAKNGLLKIFSK
jgi:large subunit ribosomal protein L3